MRLVTRADLDGLACATILYEHEPIDDLYLTHPQEILDGNCEISDQDIIANLPYDARCAKWFDHRLTTSAHKAPEEEFEGRFETSPSAAKLVWEYYGSDPRFGELVEAASRLDSADLEHDDILDPQGYILLGFTLDSRTGLGAFQKYFRSCVGWARKSSIDHVLRQPDVRDRVRRLRSEEANFQRAVRENSRLDGNVVVTDFRSYIPPPIGNRFLVYTLFPEANVAIRVHWGPEQRTLVAAVGHSIFNKTCKTSIGDLMARYGGGGHSGAGGAMLPVENADEQIEEIIEELNKVG